MDRCVFCDDRRNEWKSKESQEQEFLPVGSLIPLLGAALLPAQENKMCSRVTSLGNNLKGASK